MTYKRRDKGDIIMLYIGDDMSTSQREGYDGASGLQGASRKKYKQLRERYLSNVYTLTWPTKDVSRSSFDSAWFMLYAHDPGKLKKRQSATRTGLAGEYLYSITSGTKAPLFGLRS